MKGLPKDLIEQSILQISSHIRILGCAVIILISGCATETINIVHDEVTFKGDVQPMVSSSQALLGNIDDLTEGEALTVGKAFDGSGALSRPNPATVKVIETKLGKRKVDLNLIWERCDPDGDGILDFYCPELLAYMSDPDLYASMSDGQMELRQFVMFQSSYSLSTSRKLDEDNWTIDAQIDISEEDDAKVPIYLKLMAVNRGNKTFEGDLTVYANLPPQLLRSGYG